MRLKRFNQLNEELDKSSMMSKVTKTYINIDDESISDIENIDWVDVKECTIYWDYELNVSSSTINYISTRIIKIILDVDVYTIDDNDKIDDFNRQFEYDTMNSDIDTSNQNELQTLPFSPSEIEISHLETSEDNKVKIEIIF